jgi:hypothetical protein
LSLDVDAKSDPSLYGKKNMTSSLSSSLDVDAKSDPSLYRKEDMPPSSSSSLDVDAKSDPALCGKKICRNRRLRPSTWMRNPTQRFMKRKICQSMKHRNPPPMAKTTF